MPELKASDLEIVAALQSANGIRAEAARRLGMSTQALSSRINRLKSSGIEVPKSSYDPALLARERAGEPPPRKSKPIEDEVEFPVLPDGKIDIDVLINRRKEEFARKEEAYKARKLIPIKVKSNEPIAVCLFGDPHVDDSGTDLGKLQYDMKVIKETDGMYAGCIGDVQNNWVGRLSHLWKEQETTAGQAWQLVEWFIEDLMGKWLFMVQGNHDHWSGSGDPIRWIQRLSKVNVTGEHTVRLALRFPNGQEVRITARHDFPGNSMWNPSHGQLKAAMLTHHDHLLVSGHKHTGGYQMFRAKGTGLLTHCLQLGAYKRYDDYAEQLNLPDQMISPSATVILDPEAGELGLVRVEHDIDAAADWLTWRRSKL